MRPMPSPSPTPANSRAATRPRRRASAIRAAFAVAAVAVDAVLLGTPSGIRRLRRALNCLFAVTTKPLHTLRFVTTSIRRWRNKNGDATLTEIGNTAGFLQVTVALERPSFRCRHGRHQRGGGSHS